MKKYEKFFVIISGSIGLLVILLSSTIILLDSNSDFLIGNNTKSTTSIQINKDINPSDSFWTEDRFKF